MRARREKQIREYCRAVYSASLSPARHPRTTVRRGCGTINGAADEDRARVAVGVWSWDGGRGWTGDNRSAIADFAGNVVIIVGCVRA